MKDKFRSALFSRIRDEVVGVSGKQVKVAESLGVKQCDISIIKRGQADRFSTDKLIDIALKCGCSFDFRLVNEDRSAIDAAKEVGKTDTQKQLDKIVFDLDDL